MNVSLLLLSSLAASAPVKAPGSVDALLAQFAEQKGFEARFVETKTMAMLSSPLKSEGKLYFAAPDRLLRVVEAPHAAKVLVTTKAVTMRANGRTQHLDLAGRPEVRALVSSLLSLFSGDTAALKAAYAVDYTPKPDGSWKLALKPKDERLSKLVTAMVFDGEGRGVRRITIEEASGDRTVTEITDPKPGAKLDPSSLERRFEAP